MIILIISISILTIIVITFMNIIFNTSNCFLGFRVS